MDALFIATEAKPYRAPNFNDMLASMNSPVIFDGRNLYEPTALQKLGFTYYGVGRFHPAVFDPLPRRTSKILK